MKRTIHKHATSADIVIPAEIMQDLRLKVGDRLDFSIVKGNIQMKKVPAPDPTKNTSAVTSKTTEVIS